MYLSVPFSRCHCEGAVPHAAGEGQPGAHILDESLQVLRLARDGNGHKYGDRYVRAELENLHSRHSDEAVSTSQMG